MRVRPTLPAQSCPGATGRRYFFAPVGAGGNKSAMASCRSAVLKPAHLIELRNRGLKAGRRAIAPLYQAAAGTILVMDVALYLEDIARTSTEERGRTAPRLRDSRQSIGVNATS